MRETTVQIDGMRSISGYAGAGKLIRRRAISRQRDWRVRPCKS
jgi:hypothetical protein